MKEIVEDIRHGTTKGYGSEELTKLLKLLPEAEEVNYLVIRTMYLAQSFGKRN